MKGAIQFLTVWLTCLSGMVALQFALASYDREAGRANNRAVWHTVICSIQDSTLANRKISPEQKAEAVKFWTSLLVNKVHTKPCP